MKFWATVNGVIAFGINPLFHNFFEHTAHHVDPRIPLYNRPNAQSELEMTYGDEVIVKSFTPLCFLKLFRACRVYDFRNHCWLDYDGRRTTEPQPVTAAVRPSNLP